VLEKSIELRQATQAFTDTPDVDGATAAATAGSTSSTASATTKPTITAAKPTIATAKPTTLASSTAAVSSPSSVEKSLDDDAGALPSSPLLVSATKTRAKPKEGSRRKPTRDIFSGARVASGGGHDDTDAGDAPPPPPSSSGDATESAAAAVDEGGDEGGDDNDNSAAGGVRLRSKPKWRGGAVKRKNTAERNSSDSDTSQRSVTVAGTSEAIKRLSGVVHVAVSGALGADDKDLFEELLERAEEGDATLTTLNLANSLTTFRGLHDDELAARFSRIANAVRNSHPTSLVDRC
jgi:hypothetical protein